MGEPETPAEALKRIIEEAKKPPSTTTAPAGGGSTTRAPAGTGSVDYQAKNVADEKAIQLANLGKGAETEERLRAAGYIAAGPSNDPLARFVDPRTGTVFNRDPKTGIYETTGFTLNATQLRALRTQVQSSPTTSYAP